MYLIYLNFKIYNIFGIVITRFLNDNIFFFYLLNSLQIFFC